MEDRIRSRVGKGLKRAESDLQRTTPMLDNPKQLSSSLNQYNVAQLQYAL